MIRLLITDVDGTLVEESQSQLHPEYFEVIPQLAQKGIQVVAASGRPYSSMESLFKPVLEHMWFVSDCGASLKTTGEMESSCPIPQPWVEELWHDISQIPNCEATVCGPEGIYIPLDNSPMCHIVRDRYKMKTIIQNGWDDCPKIPTGKMSLFALENVETIAKEQLIPKWKDRLHTVISGEWWLDLMMPTTNKGTALQKIMDDHGYLPEEVMATGDNMNDIEMLTLAGTAFAVSTARDEVKAVSDRVIGSFAENAVLEEWKKLL